MSIEILVENYSKSHESQHLRFGQWFCNHYIKQPWPELYYCEDFWHCRRIIITWLTDNCYLDTLPSVVNK